MITVLVVADNIDFRRLIAASVINDGHMVNRTSTAAGALRILLASPVPVVAFFDYQLPDSTSLAVLPMIEKGGEPLQRHRYVMLTANPLDGNTQILARRLGVATLVIPCSLGDLLWEITKKVRELEDAEAARQAQAGSEVAR
jgi:CheY-like chemotaxis protein